MFTLQVECAEKKTLLWKKETIQQEQNEEN